MPSRIAEASALRLRSVFHYELNDLPTMSLHTAPLASTNQIWSSLTRFIQHSMSSTSAQFPKPNVRMAKAFTKIEL